MFRTADALYGKKLPPLTEELFSEFEKNGNRLRYEANYFGRRKFLTTAALAAGIRGKKEDFEELDRVMAEICKEECWALPAHVNRAADPEWRTCIDLFASETGQTLAELSFLYEKQLSPDTLRLVKREAERRVLKPFIEKPPLSFQWEGLKNNWNAVCAGNVGSLVLYLLPEGELRRKTSERLFHSIKNSYLAGFDDDGACEEGMGYWTYGFTYFLMYALQLRENYPDLDLLSRQEISLPVTEDTAALQTPDKEMPSAESGYPAACPQAADTLSGQAWQPDDGRAKAGKTTGAGFRSDFTKLLDPKVKSISLFFQKGCLEGGRTISFSDGGSRTPYPIGLFCCLAGLPLLFREAAERSGQENTLKKARTLGALSNSLPGSEEPFSGEWIRFPDPSCAEHFGSDHCFRYIGAWWNWSKTKEYVEKTDRGLLPAPQGLKTAGIDFFPDAQWAILRGSLMNVPVKGGHNGVSHNHDDVGSFALFAEGEAILDDLGGGEYTKEYFSDGRYNIFCNKGESHNQPIIDGCDQLPGAQYGADAFYLDGRNAVHISFAKAYGIPGLEDLRRKIWFSEDPAVLYVEDTAVSAQPLSFIENFISMLPAEMQEGGFSILGKKHRVNVLFETSPGNDPGAKKIPLLRFPVLNVKDHSDHSGTLRKVNQIQMEIPPVNEGGRFRYHVRMTVEIIR